MKYFKNISTPEELKKQFRQYCITIEFAQQRGHLTPNEVAERQRISQEAERRAVLLLTPEEFRTLYGYDPKTDSKAA